MNLHNFWKIKYSIKIIHLQIRRSCARKTEMSKLENMKPTLSASLLGWFIHSFRVMCTIPDWKWQNVVTCLQTLPKLLNTLNAGIGFTVRTSVLLSQISVILICISQINEPIPGMFVLIWMHFPRWFQILSRDFKCWHFLTILWHFWTVVCSRLPRANLLLNMIEKKLQRV